MRSKDKICDPLPETFATEEEEGEFWDTPSTRNYEESLEPREGKIKTRQRIFEVPVKPSTIRQTEGGKHQ